MSNVESERKIKMNALEIKGKVNTALCYAKVVEDEAIEQIRRMCDYAMTEGSRSVSCLMCMPVRGVR